MILRTIKCDVCGALHTETEEGAGFPQWGALQGISLNDAINPSLCPKHLTIIADYLDKLTNEEQGDGLD